MSYTPTVWKSGDVVSSVKLNKLENAVKDIFDDFDSMISAFVENGANTASNYYKKVTAFSTQKKYIFSITVPTSQSYVLKAGPEMSAGSMVDTIYSGNLTANTETFIGPYSPTGAYIYLRLDKDLSWSVKVYEYYDKLAEYVSNVGNDVANAIISKSLTAEQFAASPYNSAIGNLDINSVIRIAATYNAVDFPFSTTDNYIILTYGMGQNVSQFAIKQSDGKLFSRSKQQGASWIDWVSYSGVYSSGIVVNSSDVYSSFNDFPIGSILTITNDVELNDAPPGWENIGHVTNDSGPISAVCMTYSPYFENHIYVCQLVHIYRASNAGYPRLAYRVGVKSGSAYNWSMWSTISEDGSLHATNKIVDIDSYSTITFGDFNDAPINTIYQVDLNTGSTVLNNPSPGNSGVLMTFAFSVTTRHALVQEYIALETNDAAMYFRYGYYQAADTYVWTAWKKVQTV